MRSMALASRITASGPSRYDTLGNSTASFMRLSSHMTDPLAPGGGKDRVSGEMEIHERGSLVRPARGIKEPASLHERRSHEPHRRERHEHGQAGVPGVAPRIGLQVIASPDHGEIRDVQDLARAVARIASSQAGPSREDLSPILGDLVVHEQAGYPNLIADMDGGDPRRDGRSGRDEV